MMKTAKQKRLDFLLKLSVLKQEVEECFIQQRAPLSWLNFYTEVSINMGRTIQRLCNEKEGWVRERKRNKKGRYI